MLTYQFMYKNQNIHLNVTDILRSALKLCHFINKLIQ